MSRASISARVLLWLAAISGGCNPILGNEAVRWVDKVDATVDVPDAAESAAVELDAASEPEAGVDASTRDSAVAEPPQDATVPAVDAGPPEQAAAGRAGGGAGAGGAGASGSGAGASGSGGAGGASGEPAPCAAQDRACSVGEEDSEARACGHCEAGTQARTRSCAADSCTWGSWSDWSVCEDEGACAAGDTRMSTTACCGSGTQAWIETCSDECAWGAPKASGTCTGTTVSCTPGATQSGTENCTTCGSRQRKRTCTASCTWGAWTPTTRCTFCEQCSVVKFCNEAGSRNIVCEQQACSREQAYDDCKVDIVDVCGYAGGPFDIDYL